MSKVRERLERHGLWYALGFFLLTRLIVLAVAVSAPRTNPRAAWWSPVPTVAWDAGHYGVIALRGYPPQVTDTVAFLPAYPLLCRPLQALFLRVLPPDDPRLATDLALVIVSHLAAFAAIPLLYLWARRRQDAIAALLCVVLLSVYPPAFFFSTGYSDAVLLLCVAGILWLLDLGRIWPAAWVAAVATATRPTGLVVAAVVTLWALLNERAGDWRRRLLRAAGVGLISVSGCIAFQLYLWHHYQRPDAFAAVQSHWPNQPVEDPLWRLLTLKDVVQPAFRPVKYSFRAAGALLVSPFHGFAADDLARARQNLTRLLEPDTWNKFFNLGILVVAIIGLLRPGQIPRMLFLIPILVFLMGYVADPYRGGRLVGIARYQLIAIPCFLLLACWPRLQQSRVLLPLLIVGSMFLQCVYLRGFVNWRMVG